MADNAAAALEPLDIDTIGDVTSDPYHEDQNNAERKWKTQVIVRVLRPLGPGGKGFRVHEGQQQRPAKGDVQARDCKYDEAGGRHPMYEPLEGIEAHDSPSGSTALDTDHAAPKIERDEHSKNAENGDPANPEKSHFVEIAPIAAGGLLDCASFLIRQSTAAGDVVELLEELILCRNARFRVDRGGLLGSCGLRGS